MGRWKREGEKERKKNIRSVMSLARGIFLIFRVALFYLLFILGREAGTETRRWERGRRAGGSGGTKRPGPLPPHPELRAAGPGGGCPVPGAARPCLPHPARPRAQLRGSCSPSPRLPSPLPLSRHTRAVIRQQMNALSRQGPPADSRPVGGGRDRGAEPRTAPRPRRRTGADLGSQRGKARHPSGEERSEEKAAADPRSAAVPGNRAIRQREEHGSELGESR